MSRPAPSWRTVEQMERARWHRFAVKHADRHPLCAAVAGKPVDAIGPEIARSLANVASRHGLPLERAGDASGRKRRR